MDISGRFGANLSLCREDAGLTQHELAGLAALSRSQIGMAEGGAWLPRLEVVVRLAGSLDVSVGQLLDGITWDPTEGSQGHFNIVDLS